MKLGTYMYIFTVLLCEVLFISSSSILFSFSENWKWMKCTLDQKIFYKENYQSLFVTGKSALSRAFLDTVTFLARPVCRWQADRTANSCTAILSYNTWEHFLYSLVLSLGQMILSFFRKLLMCSVKF